MDDLINTDWTVRKNAPLQPAPRAAFGMPLSSATSSLRPSPAPSPFASNLLTASKPPPKPSSPANDMFANLVSTNANKTRSNLSLLERQKQLQQEKSKQEQEQGNKFGNEAAFWDNLGSGKSTPQPSAQVMPPPPPARHDEDDLLAAFNSAAPVDKASHFPPPTASSATSGRSTPAVNKPTSLLANDDDDDDPFGLGAAPQRRPSPYQPAPSPSIDNNDDDDILGDLGKPVVAKPPQREPVDELFAIPARHSPQPSDPLDRPIAELVDMGFPVDKSRTALKETGGDVQSAVGWLLNQAHQESRNTSQTGSRDRSQVRSSARASPAPQSRDEPRRGRDHADAAAMPAWMRQESRPGSHQRKQDNASPATADKDVAAYAQDIGSSFLKSAGSLWKTGQKNLKKAVAEFQQEGDSSTPKWMRDASTDSASARSSTPRLSAPTRTAEDLTNEAMLLEARDDRRRPTPEIRESASRPDSRVRSPAQHLPIRSQPEPRFAQPPPPQQRPNTKFSRFDVDQESSQAYVSSARRRRPEPKSQPPPEPEVDLFSPAPVQSPSEPEVDLFSPAPPKPSSTPRVTTSKASTSIPQAPRPRAPPRNIPAISPSALSSSSNHRQAGTDAYKRGDYDAAHTCYSSALGCLPPNHPLLIIVLCNRALTAIKTGDPKAAVTDAETALQLIGPFKGENETINLGNNEGEKEMKEFYGKAVMRKAEALENMEKWSEAASVWKDAVAAGVGGAVSLRARDRCERAAANTSTSSTTCKPAPTFSKPAVRPPGKLAQPPQSQEAVRKLRAANAAADAADDEKFALSDQVEAKISNWKNGKSDNLRALLASLDTILWDEAGWKKVNMSDLIIANKVKIVYMKAIAKVHPDKISQNATTEQKMISGSVFSILNEAWDGFKQQNGL